MKKYAIALSLIFLFLSCKESNSEVKVDNKYKRYPVESGIVKYKSTINGKVMGSKVSGKGESTLYFKNYGALELKEEQSEQSTEIKIFGKEKIDITEEHSITKLENGNVYTVDFENKKINKVQNIGADMLKGVDVNYMGRQMLETMGGKQLESEKFMGYDCEVWGLNGAKQYFYKGIPLKSEMTMMGITTITEATEAKFDVKVSDDKFELPDYEVVEVKSMMTDENIKELMESEEFSEEMKEAKENMDKMSNMSFDKWKKMVKENDPDMAKMSDKELKSIYDMTQKMSKVLK